MTNMYELLITCPEDQVTRCRVIYRAIVDGQWEDAAFSLSIAIRETQGTQWASDAWTLLEYINER